MNVKNTIKLINKIKKLDAENYNKNISYCGLWSGNTYRTKLKIHKILPFNKFCFIHDKGYFLLSEHFKDLSYREFIALKKLIDKIFYQNMKMQDNTYLNNITSYCFINIVKLATPLYYCMFAIKEYNKK